MEDIPAEFKQFAAYLVAAEDVRRYNPIVSQVLTQVFVDICRDIAPQSKQSNIKEFMRNLTENLPEFPRDGPDETKLLADDIYDSLTSKLREGKVNPHIIHQFWLCGILYSVLAGDQAEKRERICKITAIRLRKAFESSRVTPPLSSPTHAPKKSKSLPTESKILPPNPAPHTQLPVTFDSVINNFSENNAIEYLKTLGVHVPSSIPPLNQKFKSKVSQNLDLSLNSIRQNDMKQVKSYLVNANEFWECK